jgi:hypothetical protein
MNISLLNKKPNVSAAKSKAHLEQADIRLAYASCHGEKWEREPLFLEGDRFFVDCHSRGDPLHESIFVESTKMDFLSSFHFVPFECSHGINARGASNAHQLLTW